MEERSCNKVGAWLQIEMQCCRRGKKVPESFSAPIIVIRGLAKKRETFVFDRFLTDFSNGFLHWEQNKRVLTKLKVADMYRWAVNQTVFNFLTETWSEQLTE